MPRQSSAAYIYCLVAALHIPRTRLIECLSFPSDQAFADVSPCSAEAMPSLRMPDDAGQFGINERTICFQKAGWTVTKGSGHDVGDSHTGVAARMLVWDGFPTTGQSIVHT